MVGLIPLYACLVLEDEVIQKLHGFRKRLEWFLKNRQDLATQVWALPHQREREREREREFVCVCVCKRTLMCLPLPFPDCLPGYTQGGPVLSPPGNP